MMDFSSHAGAASTFDTIPNGQLAWAILQVKGVKSSASGGQYIDCELTIDQGQPYAGRRVFEMIGNPFHQGNSEAYRQMGMIAITRILEAGRGAGPNNPAGYKLNDFAELSNLRVAIKIGVEAGKDGHDDKNRVSEWLTPNPASQSGHKHYQKLVQGIFNASAQAQQPPASGFGAPAAPAPGAQQQFGGFGNAGTSAGSQPAPATPTSGFGAPGGGPQPGFQQPPATSSESSGGFATSAGTPSTSPAAATAPPSNPGATPGWLQQAGGAPQG